MNRLLALIVIISFTSASLNAAESVEPSIKDALSQWSTASHRSNKHIHRNQYRNPSQTLRFFGLTPEMTVVEIWPGTGWYTEILAPYLKQNGTLYAAHFSASQPQAFFAKMQSQFSQKLKSEPTYYGGVVLTSIYPPGKDLSNVKSQSTDMVLTFRNVHNWSKAGYDQAMFDAFYRMLKPNGILGVVEHRAKPTTDFQKMIKTGYMTADYVTNLATKAGFKLVASSEINANLKDTKSHPNGVWSLPPSLRGGDDNKDHYINIGESDRMTLKFIKGDTH